jgi:Tol biopolymer transport system component
MSAEVPSAPVLLESEKIGLITRSMMWSPDSRQIVFSSDRGWTASTFEDFPVVWELSRSRRSFQNSSPADFGALLQ